MRVSRISEVALSFEFPYRPAYFSEAQAALQSATSESAVENFEARFEKVDHPKPTGGFALDFLMRVPFERR